MDIKKIQKNEKIVDLYLKKVDVKNLLKYEKKYGISFLFKNENIKPDFQEERKPKFDLPFVNPSDPNTINADYHGFGGNMHTKDQRELIHGLDMSTAKPVRGTHLNTAGSNWNTNVLTGQKAIVKPASGVGEGKGSIQHKLGHIDTRGFNGPRREVMFHNLARDFFGLGSHVPMTAGFTKHGEDYSVQEHVDAHPLNEHGYKSRQVPKTVENAYKKSLAEHHKKGDLHKLAMMDFIMGNHDRHRGNFMLGRHDNKLYMIDNSLAFDYGKKTTNDFRGLAPGYLNSAEYHDVSDKPHPESAKWLSNLSDKAAMRLWKHHGFEPEHPAVKGFLDRLHNLKGAINSNPEEKLSNIINLAGKHNTKVNWENTPTQILDKHENIKNSLQKQPKYFKKLKHFL